MEQARFWNWTKWKHDFGSHVFAPRNNPSYGDSWEEKAFAEDAAGALGGCVWPPRSYTCSFCRREFKSAQALGGHMNVHRRDRARLKQSPTPHIDVLPHTHILNPCASLDEQNSPPQICNTFLYNQSSNSDHPLVFTASSPPARVSSSPQTKIVLEEKLLNPPFFSSILSENHPKSSMSSPQAWSNLVADKYFHVSDLTNDDKSFKTSKSNGRANDEYVKTDLSVSLNLLLCRTHSRVSSDAEEFPSCTKRRRTDHETFSNTFLSKSKSGPLEKKCQIPQSDAPALSPNYMDDLDLELRLGDPPQGVKRNEQVPLNYTKCGV